MGFHFKANKEADKPVKFEPVPDGDYLLRVKKVPAHSLTGTNRDMLTIQLVVDEGEYEGKSVRYNLIFVPEFENNEPQKGHGMTVRALKAFGMAYDGDLDIEPNEYLDKVVRAHVKRVKDDYYTKDPANPVFKNEIGWFIVEDDGSQVEPSSKSSSASKAPVREEDEVPF